MIYINIWRFLSEGEKIGKDGIFQDFLFIFCFQRFDRDVPRCAFLCTNPVHKSVHLCLLPNLESSIKNVISVSSEETLYVRILDSWVFVRKIRSELTTLLCSLLQREVFVNQISIASCKQGYNSESLCLVYLRFSSYEFKYFCLSFQDVWKLLSGPHYSWCTCFCCRNNIPANFTRSGNKLSHQKDTRQATFLFRRGLKV